MIKKFLFILILMISFSFVSAEDEEKSCRSSFRVYNNTSQTITVNNGADVDTVPSGSYSYTWGDCGTPVLYSAKGTFVNRTGVERTCSYKSEGEWIYPDEDGKIESISITSICDNGEKSGIEIQSFANTKQKLSKWSNAKDPKKYAYGVAITATYNGEPLEGVQFTVTDSKNIIIKDIYNQEAVKTTNKKGEVRFYLYAGYSYLISQTGVNEKYSIQNGEIVLDSANATILEMAKFKESAIEEYLKIEFKNDFSDEELLTLSLVEKEIDNINSWKVEKETELRNFFNYFDYSKYNENEQKEIHDIEEKANQDLEELTNSYLKNVEYSVRNKEETKYTFEITKYKELIQNVTPHWEHWILVAIIIVCFVLNFIFNKHLLISLLIFAGLFILYIDYCQKSLIFFIILAIICVVFIVLGFVVDNDEEEIDEQRN